MPRGENLACGWSFSWCFTWNNYPENAKEIILGWIDKRHVKYLIAGAETAPTTNTKHIQGYVYWRTNTSFAKVKEFIPTAHWERAKGSWKQNADYCSKESILIEHGEPPRAGARTDINEVREILQSGGSMRDVMIKATSYQAAKFGEMFLKYAPPQKRDWIPTVKWIWGPSGVGKTRMAFAESKDAWISNKSLEWWEGYTGQSDVILDDFRGSHCNLSELLRILDRYPYRVMFKGGSCELLAKNIWITSCFSPQDCYRNCGEKINQLLRRISEIIHIKPPEEPLPEPIQVELEFNIDELLG